MKTFFAKWEIVMQSLSKVGGGDDFPTHAFMFKVVEYCFLLQEEYSAIHSWITGIYSGVSRLVELHLVHLAGSFSRNKCEPIGRKCGMTRGMALFNCLISFKFSS